MTTETTKFAPESLVVLTHLGVRKLGTVSGFARGKYTVKVDNGKIKVAPEDLKKATAKDIKELAPAEVAQAGKVAEVVEKPADNGSRRESGDNPDHAPAPTATAPDVEWEKSREPASFVPIPDGSNVCVTEDDGNAYFGTVVSYDAGTDVYTIKTSAGPTVTTSPANVEYANPFENADLTEQERKVLETEEEEGSQKTMSKQLTAARKRYRPVKKSDGSKSADCGDGIALALENKEPVEVAGLADVIMGEEPGYHERRYIALNPGQVRMNSGNRIRAHYRKMMGEGNITVVNQIRQHLGMDLMEVLVTK